MACHMRRPSSAKRSMAIAHATEAVKANSDRMAPGGLRNTLPSDDLWHE